MDANTARKRPTFIEETLKKTAPHYEPEVEEAMTIKEIRGSLSTPMLDVVFRDGKIRSFSYAYLSEVEFVPGDELIIKFSTGAAIYIEGTGLAYHRQQVRLHRADAIRELSESELALAVEGVPQVERITITEGDRA